MVYVLWQNRSFVCKVLIEIMRSGSDKLTGSRRSSVKSAKAICIEVSKSSLLTLFANNLSVHLPLLTG